MLISGSDNKTLTTILDRVFAELARGDEDKKKLRQAVEEVIEENRHHVQKVGLVRFNPFANTGGDQSFILTLLDGEDNGIILTSLHSRGMTRWYAKSVANGKGVDHQLSKEEEHAMKQSVRVGKIERENKKSRT